MSRIVEAAVLALQGFHVLFLLLHDWIPLGRFNDLHALRKVDSVRKVLWSTIVSSAPFIALLALSVLDFPMSRYPVDLRRWLWVGYGLLFVGELQAWWVPYFTGTSAVRVARYRSLFGSTSSFLSERHGIVPNTLHVILHAGTLVLLILLFWL